MQIRTIEARVHGRYLLRPARVGAAAPRLLVGFHGYAERAETMLERLSAIDEPGEWWLVSVQGLHRFYARDSVVASWMTREDRELAIADNILYVRAVIDAVAAGRAGIVYVGYSQGAAMAWRAAAHGPRARGLIVFGGDVPPEIAGGRLDAAPPVLIGRGRDDAIYTRQQFERDLAVLDGRVAVTPCEVDGGHEWSTTFRERAREFLRSISFPAP